MESIEVLANPGNKVVLECSFNNLMQKVTRDELVDISAWEIMCKRLKIIVSGGCASALVIK